MKPCQDLISSVAQHQNKHDMQCPILAYPNCHPKGHFLVHVDGKKKIIFLSCSVCDKLTSVIRLKGKLNGNMGSKTSKGV